MLVVDLTQGLKPKIENTHSGTITKGDEKIKHGGVEQTLSRRV